MKVELLVEVGRTGSQVEENEHARKQAGMDSVVVDVRSSRTNADEPENLNIASRCLPVQW